MGHQFAYTERGGRRWEWGGDVQSSCACLLGRESPHPRRLLVSGSAEVVDSSTSEQGPRRRRPPLGMSLSESIKRAGGPELWAKVTGPQTDT